LCAHHRGKIEAETLYQKLRDRQTINGAYGPFSSVGSGDIEDDGCTQPTKCRKSCNADLVADGEALARMRRLLDLVDKGDCIVGKRDAAALIIAEKGIFAEAELAGALAGHGQR
jgi:hypothetical protein